jgi:hypothetical protein
MIFQGTPAGLRNASQYLNQQGQLFVQDFNKEVTSRARRLAQQIQNDLNAKIAGGPVNFTSKSILFRYVRNSDGTTTNQIIVKNIQAQYLYDVIVKPSLIEKYIPTSNAKLTAQGNIQGLRKNLASGKYKVVKTNGTKRLIDTSKNGRKRKERVIGVREKKKRKLIYDFYHEAEQGALLILSDVRGRFVIQRV